MQAEYSVELGREDPALELPWEAPPDSPGGRYCNLKGHPELVSLIPEATQYPELGAFLAALNAAGSPFETAKCDVWFSGEIAPEEEIFAAYGKHVSYIDLIFAANGRRMVFERHEELARTLCDRLRRAPDMPAAIELVIRRCYYHPEGSPEESSDGFCITAYITGFGEDQLEARQRWTIAIALLQHSLLQEASSF